MPVQLQRAPIALCDLVVLSALLLSLTVPRALLAAGPPALEPPPPAAVAEGRRIVAAMRASERGPYARLRWFCADGAVLPPEAYACREHGGGHQHGEYSADRRRLAEVGWPAGTILAATPFDELFDAAHHTRRLRLLLVERYLVEVDDGWVMQRARYYRGHVQVEDEEDAGRALLIELLSAPAWVADEVLLAREAVRTVPHHTGSDRTSTIRATSQAIAERDPSFERLRIRIHTSPSPADVAAVRVWIAEARRRQVDPTLLARAEELAASMAALYGSDGSYLELARRGLVGDPRWPALEPLVAATMVAPVGRPRVAAAAAAMLAIRQALPSAIDGRRNLALVDLSLALEREVLRSAFATLSADTLPRRELATLADDLLTAVEGAGLLSSRERSAVAAPLERLLAGDDVSRSAWSDAIQDLRRVAGWAHASVRHSFGEAVVAYGALEPAARRYADNVLRGSAMLPLAAVVTTLAADADQLRGASHRVFGERSSELLGLNPGLAVGRLRVLTEEDLQHGVLPARDEIVVLPTTTSDLVPVAGILTLAEGNLLSHVQLLARNLGIPNATAAPALGAAIAARAGDEVVLAVAADGTVTLEEVAALPAAVATLIGGDNELPPTKLEPPRPELSVRHPLPLAELRASMAGVLVGPKAANLGQLAATFPGRVEQAIALPFGVFAAHVGGGPGSPKARLDEAFARHRAGTLDDAGLTAEIAAVRAAVTALELQPPLAAELATMMAEVFGPPGSYGVFVRSDTNVEDLPGFTGAGLNETIPNVVDPAEQRRAIARVWASPLTERAVAWRAPLLTRPEEVYTSVLLMKSVPADKSGVLVTADLVGRRAGITVATAWGVGGAVDGDAAETLVLTADGGERLIGEAKAPYRRRLKPTGGVDWVPAAAGQVLTAAEQNELRTLAREVTARLEPAAGPDGRPLPWDVEFGFVGGRLQLFQIRPLVERGSALANRVVAALSPPQAGAPSRVDLTAAVALRPASAAPPAR